jgi:hypothetical protein
MTRKLSIAGLVAAAAASSALTFGIAPAQAACVTAGPETSQNCVTFDSAATTTTLTAFGFADAGWIDGTALTNLRFSANSTVLGSTDDWTFTPDPITISNIEYSFDWTGDAGTTSWTQTGLTSTSVTLASGGTSVNAITGTNSLGSIAKGSAFGSTFAVRFTVPTTTTSNNGQLGLRVGNSGAPAGNQTQTRLYNATSSTPATGTPGPLPLLGAGAAFGFSRRLRSRVRIAA